VRSGRWAHAGVWARAGQLRSQIGLRGPLILLSFGVVFVCCFALGRTMHAGAAARGESASLPIEAFSAASPLRIGSAPATERALAPPVRPAPARKPRTAPRAVAPAPAPGAEGFRGEEAPAPA